MNESPSAHASLDPTAPVRVLVTGAHGQLGRRLQAVAGRRNDVEVVALGREAMDVCRLASIHEALDRHRPHAVINAAAYTAVDRAESEEALAHEVNAVGPGALADACAARGVALVHVSTDYVFGNVPHRPLKPGDPVGPLGAYGRTKLEGERRVLASNACAAVVRVSWLYDAEGHNFLNTMVRLATERGALKVVNDQHGIPTAAPVLAEALLDLSARGQALPQGVWHFAHEGQTTWHGFAVEIMRLAGLEVPVEPVPTSAFPTPAVRPSWSVLDGSDLREAMGWPAVHWKDALERTWRLRKEGGDA